MGEAATDLHDLADRCAVVSGAELLGLAERIEQVTDGTFVGRPQDDAEPVLSIHAIDSSLFAVGTTQPWAFEALTKHFGQRVVADEGWTG